MEHYQPGEVGETPDAPSFTITESTVVMRVNSGSKIRNLMGYAIKRIKEEDTSQLCWSASGPAVSKAVSCAEIMKRRIKGLHQITDIRFKRIFEYWDPKTEDRLDRLKVTRDVPAISILLSKQPVGQSHPGYQPPGSFEAFWQKKTKERPADVRPKESHPAHNGRGVDGGATTNNHGMGRQRRRRGGYHKVPVDAQKGSPIPADKGESQESFKSRGQTRDSPLAMDNGTCKLQIADNAQSMAKCEGQQRGKPLTGYTNSKIQQIGNMRPPNHARSNKGQPIREYGAPDSVNQNSAAVYTSCDYSDMSRQGPVSVKNGNERTKKENGMSRKTDSKSSQSLRGECMDTESE